MRNEAASYIGETFDRLVVVGVVVKRYRGFRRTFFRCKCSCGKATTVLGSHILNGNTRSCGCRRLADITGRRFGRLVALRYEGREGQRTLWECQCDCGNTISAPYQRLTVGDVKSCGCLKTDYEGRGKRHDYSSKEYRAWSLMHQRCSNVKNPSYKYYGARGVSVAREWTGRGGFDRFLAHLGKSPSAGHSLDRIDPELGYGPGNCRWATIHVQNRHLRPKRLIAYNGDALPLIEWARKLNRKYSVLYGRLYTYHWSVEEAFTRPCKSFHAVSEQQSKEYSTWARIKYRCGNPNNGAYTFYGGRGIQVCERWRGSFDTFLADVGKAPSKLHTLDRIDSGRGYEPGNVRWATRAEQARNTSATVLITYRGATRCLSEWSRVLDVNISTLRYWIERGHSIGAIKAMHRRRRRGAA